jgi:GMP synthase-like glutamine amidotransferase
MTGRPCLVLRYTDVTQQRLEALGVEAILISGNATTWDHYERAELAAMCDVIRRATWPILGFCGGHQLIGLAHGAPVAPMRRLQPGEPDATTLAGPGYFKEWGFTAVDVVDQDPILDGLGPSPVFLEVHYCELKELPPGFQRLASTADCRLQVIKQAGRPVYGTQFHPEGYTEMPDDRRSALVGLVYPGGHAHARPDGRTLIANFFRMAGICG